MTKDDILKILLAFFLIMTGLAFLAGQVSTNEAYDVATAIGSALALMAALSLGVERGTELVKIILRFAFGNIPLLNKLPLQPQGAGSAVLAVILAWASVNKFDVEIFNKFPVFTNLNPELVSLITVAITWLLSALWHTAFPKTIDAQPVKAMPPKK